DVAPAIVTYVVQKGETLWDVAVQHGVSMRTIRDLNKLPGKEPVLAEGQQLLVPASGITAVPTVDEAASAAALGSTPARGLWAGSDHVRLASVSDARQLYLRQCERGNSQNTLLVLFAPWCPHCRDMEDELERLAEGLSAVPAVRVVAVNGDSPEGRLFAREVLGVAYYPSIIAFPQHSRTFFKYKGRQRDAEALLRFLNMTCCAREDAMWSLRPVGTTAAVAGGGGKGGPLQWANQVLPVGTSPGALATGLAALAAAALTASVSYRAVRRRSAAAAAAGGDGSGVEANVVAELDSSLGRMATLMLRAVGTRLALMLGLVQASPSPPAVAVAAVAEVAVETGAAAGAPVALPPAAAASAATEEARALGEGLASATQGSSSASAPAASDTVPVQPMPGPESSSPCESSSGSSDGCVGAVPATTTAGSVAAAQPTSAEGAAAASAAGSSSPTPVPHRELTAEERLRLTRLTDDELIALVNSEPDLDKVLSRLLGDR
ncbi:hypothetical protein Agub_g6207, partial [Astrephomene gubernaculifera]